jgi:hypothetical protein
MFGARTGRIASSFSLLLLLSTVGFSADYVQLKRQLDKASKPEQALDVLLDVDLEDDAELEDAVTLAGNATNQADLREKIVVLRGMVELRALASSQPVEPAAKVEAKRIKSSPLYHDPGLTESSNWLDEAMRRLLKLLPRFDRPNIQTPRGSLPGWLVPLMWGILGAAVVTFGYFAFRHFSWKRSARRRARAVLEEDEPDRTLDEWLQLADQLSAEGRYREAVRALYLACLLRFDEHNVARFVRGETNWEHLARIQASARRPAGLDFVPPTKLFDRIWYGKHVRGIEDVDEFRAWYKAVTQALTEARAA